MISQPAQDRNLTDHACITTRPHPGGFPLRAYEQGEETDMGIEALNPGAKPGLKTG